ncbi:helix-turn-helix domain-containing protein [Acidovorax carolinensis]|nr:helix-turn-helix transcriptional regulator [Acidovorax carolinensis]
MIFEFIVPPRITLSVWLNCQVCQKQTDSLWIDRVSLAKLPAMDRVVVNKPQPLEARFAQERDRVQAAFGKRVREFRTEQQLTLEMLAEKADLHENYVGAVERGERNLSLYNVWRLAGGLGLSVAELVQDLPARKAKRTAAS